MKIEFILKEKIMIDLPSNIRTIMTKDGNLQFNQQLVGTQKSAELKPNGLWYAIGDEWIQWIKSESPQWAEKYLYEIQLDLSKILVLDTVEKVKSINNSFGANFHGYPAIDWERLSRHYSGIELNPYFWNIRTQMPWYAPWDIASGCIWKQDCIKDIKLLSDNWKDDSYEEDII